MVLVAHIMGGTAEHVYADSAAYLAFSTPIWNLGTYFVYLFFAISGFVILPSAFRYSAQEFARRRFWRIYPLFLVCTIVFIIGNAVTNLHPDQKSIWVIINALMFTNLLAGTEQLTPNAWSLSYEVMFYVLAAAMAFSMTQRRQKWLFVTAIASIAFLVIFPRSVYFLVGIVVFILHRRGKIRTIPMRSGIELILILALVYSAASEHFDFRPGDMAEPVNQVTILLSGLYFLFAVERDSLTARLLSGKWPQYLGTISYSLYLVHPYVYMPMRVLFGKAGFFTDNIVFSVMLFGIATFIVSIAAAHASYILFEKLPQKIAKKDARGTPVLKKEEFL